MSATEPSELEEAVIRTKVAVAQAKSDGRTFVLLYTDDAHELLKRLTELEGECEELLS